MQSKKYSNLIYGRHPVIEAIQSGKTIDKVVIQQGVRGEFEKEIRALTKEFDIPLQYSPKEKLNKIVSGTHQGIIAWLSLLSYQKLEDVLPFIFENGENPLLLLLDGITDVGNFGAIARSAEVAGAHALIVPLKGSAQINAEAIKSSAGALNIISVCRENSLSNTIKMLKSSGIKIFASDLKAQKSIYELDLTGPTAFIIGAEGEGISPHLAREADQKFIIPQKGETDSLNVSVATGIMLFEANRQRDNILSTLT